MGLLSTILSPLETLLATQPTWIVSISLFGLAITTIILLNIANQLLLRNPNEPPVVFHWLPLIGSTISYGMDPFVFFAACREKVRTAVLDICFRLTMSSMETVLRSYYLGRKPPFALD